MLGNIPVVEIGYTCIQQDVEKKGEVEYIQDDEITSSRTVNNDAVLVGRDVDPTDTEGDVYLMGGKLTLNATIEVTIDKGFYMTGGELDINMDNSNCN